MPDTLSTLTLNSVNTIKIRALHKVEISLACYIMFVVAFTPMLEGIRRIYFVFVDY